MAQDAATAVLIVPDVNYLLSLNSSSFSSSKDMFFEQKLDEQCEMMM